MFIPQGQAGPAHWLRTEKLPWYPPYPSVTLLPCPWSWDTPKLSLSLFLYTTFVRAPHLFHVLGEGRVGPKTQPQVHSTRTPSAVSVSWGLPSSYLQAIFSIHSLNNL